MQASDDLDIFDVRIYVFASYLPSYVHSRVNICLENAYYFMFSSYSTSHYRNNLDERSWMGVLYWVEHPRSNVAYQLWIVNDIAIHGLLK